MSANHARWLGLALAVGPASAQSFELTHEFRVPGGPATSVALDPSGTHLASGGEQGELILWNRSTGKPVWEASLGDHPVASLTFSPSGTRIAGGGRHVSVRRVTDGAELFTWDSAASTAVAWSPDGRWLAYHSGNGVVNVHDTSDWALRRSFHRTRRYPVGALAFDRAGERLLAGGNGGQLNELDLRDGSVRPIDSGTERGGVGAVGWHEAGPVWATTQALRVGRRVAARPERHWAVAFDPVRGRFATGGASGSLQWFDGDLVPAARVELGAQVRDLAFGPDGTELAAALEDGRIEVLRDGEVVTQLSGHPATCIGITFTPDGRTAVAAGERTGIALDLATGSRRVLDRGGILAPGRTPKEILMHHTGRLGEGGEVEFVDVTTGDPVEVLPAQSMTPVVLQLSPRGDTLHVGGKFHERAERTDLATGERAEDTEFGHYLDLQWSATGWRATARVSGAHGERGSLELTDPRGEVVLQRDFRASVNTVAFSPDGDRLCYTNSHGNPLASTQPALHVVEIPTMSESRIEGRSMRWLRYLDDAHAIAIENSSLVLLETTSWRVVAEIATSVRDAVLSPGRKHVLAHDTKTARIYRIEL